jgi:hypothetical protein
VPRAAPVIDPLPRARSQALSLARERGHDECPTNRLPPPQAKHSCSLTRAAANRIPHQTSTLDRSHAQVATPEMLEYMQELRKVGYRRRDRAWRRRRRRRRPRRPASARAARSLGFARPRALAGRTRQPRRPSPPSSPHAH